MDAAGFSNEHCGKLLVDRFPGRKDEIEQLLSIVGERDDTFPPVLLYGNAATGKTSLVREAFECLHRPFAYVSCRSCHNPRLLFESVLNQLVAHVRCESNNYASAKKCERTIDFIYQLGEAIATACARARPRGRKGGKSSIVDDSSDRMRDMVYLVFDDVELIRKWTDGATLISSLVSLSDITKLSNLGLIFISNCGPDTFQLGITFRDLIPLYFRTFTNEELHSILVKCHPTSEHYPLFLKTSLAPFSRVSRTLSELFDGLRPLFENYCESIRQGNQGSRNIFTHVKGHVQQALSVTYSIADSHTRSGKVVKETGKETRNGALGFHLSHCSKYLVLASYIASRNPSTHDDALFGVGDVSTRRKRPRRSSMSALEKKDAELQEKRLTGPSNCPLERLMAIYKCVAAHGASASQEQESDANDVTSDVLMELANLTSVNLILSSASSPLDGLPRYRSNVDSEFVHKVVICFPQVSGTHPC